MKNKRTPEIRFEGFTESWEQRKLDTILKERKVKQKISNEAPLLAFAAGQGVIDRSERKTNNRDFLTKDPTEKTYLLTKYDDIVYNPSNLKYGAIDRNKHGQGVISPIYVTFETDEIPSFIELILKSESFKQRALQFEEGTVTKRQSVKPENLLSLGVILPSLKDEQKKIGDFFKQLDDTTTLHQRELTTLKQTKQGFSQKMFPREGETVPEVRFPGFTGDWEQCKFENVLNKKDGIRRGPFGSALKKEFFVSSSDYVVYEQQNAIYDNYKTRYNITKEKFEELKNFKLSEGDFILSGAGTIGRISRVPKGIKEGVFNQALIRFKINDNTLDPEYFIQWIRSDNMQKKLTGANPGSAITNLVPMSEVKKWDVVVPSKDEQTQIGNFFKHLDDTITLHQRELDYLKETKKAFLQKMFV